MIHLVFTGGTSPWSGTSGREGISHARRRGAGGVRPGTQAGGPCSESTTENSPPLTWGTRSCGNCGITCPRDREERPGDGRYPWHGHDRGDGVHPGTGRSILRSRGDHRCDADRRRRRLDGSGNLTDAARVAASPQSGAATRWRCSAARSLRVIRRQDLCHRARGVRRDPRRSDRVGGGRTRGIWGGGKSCPGGPACPTLPLIPPALSAECR